MWVSHKGANISIQGLIVGEGGKTGIHELGHFFWCIALFPDIFPFYPSTFPLSQIRVNAHHM